MTDHTALIARCETEVDDPYSVMRNCVVALHLLEAIDAAEHAQDPDLLVGVAAAMKPDDWRLYCLLEQPVSGEDRWFAGLDKIGRLRPVTAEAHHPALALAAAVLQAEMADG